MHCGGRLVVALTLGLLSGCSGDPRVPAQEPRSASTSARGPVVARVDGETIGLAEVQQLCSATGLSEHDALERLVAERLLVAHASRQGYGELAVVERAAAQARVRALLARTIEHSGSPTPLRVGEAPHAATVAEQKEQLDRFLAKLTQEARVTYDEAAIQQAFKHDSP